MGNIQKAIRLKEELDTLRPLSAEDEARIMQKFRLDWNYHSNHLEGNSLTYGETKALILFGITAQGKPLQDHFEITGHNEAINWVLDVIKEDRPITENFIRELHKLILKEPYESDAITPDGKPTKKRIKIGEYKTTPNHVRTRTGEIFRFASPEETPARMKDLLDWYKVESQKEEVNPILLSAQFHYKFIRIHPFDDGNGRTVRILMNFILMRFGYPPVIIKTEDKESYFAALQQADAGLMEPFVEYIAENLIRSLEIMIKGAKGESVEDPEDLEKEIALLETKLKGVGNQITVSKSREVFLNIFTDSVLRLQTSLIQKGSLLENFYVNHDFLVEFNPDVSFSGKENAFRDSLKKLTEIDSLPYKVNLVFNYQYFKTEGMGEFNYPSQISMTFNTTNYIVLNRAGDSVSKLYNEQLTDEEIQRLVNGEIRHHKAFIEKAVADHQNDR